MLRIGIIGAGGYGRYHVDGFLILQAEGTVKITALADPSGDTLTALAALPMLKNVLCFNDYRELLDCGEVDAVVICSPIPLHEEMALEALSRDLFILLEKPPVPLLSQLEKLIAADVNGRVMVGFQHIYSDSIQRLKQKLVAGGMGRILSISAQGLSPRSSSYFKRSSWSGQLEWNGRPVLDGPCTNAFAHFINLVFFLAGDKTKAFALPTQLVGEVYRARTDIATYDTGCLTGKLENDIRFFAGFSHAVSDASRLEIVIRGENGNFYFSEGDETRLTSDTLAVPWQEGRYDQRRAFAAFAKGDVSQNKTPLTAMRAYVLATNLMFFSSGGIHQISSEHVRNIQSGAEDGIFAIEGIGDVFAQAAGKITPLCQIAAPWAQSTMTVDAESFSEAKMLEKLLSSSCEAKQAGV